MVCRRELNERIHLFVPTMNARAIKLKVNLKYYMKAKISRTILVVLPQWWSWQWWQYRHENRLLCLDFGRHCICSVPQKFEWENVKEQIALWRWRWR